MTGNDSLTPLRALSLIRDVPDFPVPGILFKDITPALADAAALREIIAAMAEAIRPMQPDHIVGIESRGFIFGVPVALELGIGFSPIRKPGKLPYEKIAQEYTLEYGTNVIEIHTDAVRPGQRVVIVDDLLATGGTAQAAGRLVEAISGQVVGYGFVVELAFLGGRARLERQIASLITY
ncbi:MAG: adenine phosphoribosyltransferase [Capsulimonadales bacterium]|nr:adenine phosphoribosyltransferase [Capsulimonadales bacterium]